MPTFVLRSLLEKEGREQFGASSLRDVLLKESPFFLASHICSNVQAEKHLGRHYSERMGGYAYHINAAFLLGTSEGSTV